MPIGKLMAEHCRVLELAGALEKIVAGPRPVVSGLFMLARSTLAQAVLTHLSRDEALVLLPLMGDRRPHISQLAIQSHGQLCVLRDDVKTHMERWNGLPGADDWPQYRREALALIRRLRARIAVEESGIYHFLPAQQPERRPASVLDRTQDRLHAC